LDSTITGIIFLLILLALSAFFSGSEAALYSLTRAQVRRLKSGSFSGRLIAEQLATPRNLLVTILLGNLIVNIASTSIVTSASIAFFGERGVIYAFLAMSILILLCGELLPKVIALGKPEKVAGLVIVPLVFLHKLFYPARLPLSYLTDAVIDRLKARLGHARKYFSSEELRTAVDDGLTEGSLGEFSHDVLSNILQFREKLVKEIMTPTVEVFSLPFDSSREEIIECLSRSRFSRVLIHGASKDEIKGFLHIKDLLKLQGGSQEFDLSSFLREPLYIPEAAHISTLFEELAKRRIHLAVVIDEYGSFVGIVTMEDILEELVGEIRDAKEPERMEYHLLADGKIVVPGTMEIDRFNEVFGTGLTSGEFETVAGYVMGVAGRIPHEGETIVSGGLRFHIISAEPNRILKMKVERA